MGEESRFHYMNCLVSISGSRLYQIEQEKKFLDTRNDVKLNRDCTSYFELYGNKMQRQQALMQQLRRQQKNLNENSNEYLRQKSMFKDLLQLLECKKQLHVQQQQ